MAIGYLSYKNVNLLLGFWGKGSTLSIYLKPDALDNEKKILSEKIKNFSEVDNINFIDRKMAAEDFKKSLGEYASGILTEDELIDLLPESFIVSLKSNYSTSEQRVLFDKISTEVKNLAVVDEVTFGGEWIKKFSKLDRILRLSGFLMLCLLSLCAAVISAFMVSSLVEESKQEIEVYSLVGATHWDIYKKFFRQIGYFHIISMTLTLVLSVLVFFVIKNYFLKAQGFLFISESISYFNFTEGFLFLLMITAFVFLGAYLAMNTSLRKLQLYAAE